MRRPRRLKFRKTSSLANQMKRINNVAKKTPKRVRGVILGGGNVRKTLVLGGGVGFGMNSILANRKSPTLKKNF